MTTFAPCQASHLVHDPSAPSQQAIASRGRRPALIPHNADLNLSLSAASAALEAATYSPNREKAPAGVWVLPPPPQPRLIPHEGWGNAAQPQPNEDRMDVDCEAVGDAVKRDIFSWVNSPTCDEFPRSPAHPGKSALRDSNPYLNTTPPQLDTSHIPPLPARNGVDTAPASPTSGGSLEIEMQKRRLEEAEREVGMKTGR